MDGGGGKSKQRPGDPAMSAGDPRPRLLLLQTGEHLVEVLLDGEPLAMSQLERLLLARLARHPGTMVLRDELRDELSVKLDSLYNHVSTLRTKLGGARFVRLVGGRTRPGRPSHGGYALVGLDVEWREMGRLAEGGPDP